MSKERIQIPSIRFSEYFNVWKICKLKEISERITKKNSELESSLPLTISAQYGLVDQITYFNKRIASKNITNYYLLEKGDFAYNKSYSKDYPWGVVKRLDGYDKGVLSTLYIVFKPTRVNSNFLLTYYDTNNWHKEVSMRAAEGARNHGLLNITALDFFDTDLFIPVEKEEQKKIGEFFKRLEETIILHQQLLNNHKQLKKAMLQKMFPQKGESVPRVRLSGFSDKWNKDKIENLLIERNERSGEGELISVTINSGVVKTADLNRTDNSSKDKSNYKKVKKDDIAYNSMRMWQGASGMSEYTGIVSPAYTIIIPKENVSPLFISYLFKLPSMIQTFQANSQGLTSDTWNLKYPMLKKIKIKLPELKEQEKIGNFLKQLDETIVLHEKTLETYQNLKKAMLQKMFV